MFLQQKFPDLWYLCIETAEAMHTNNIKFLFMVIIDGRKWLKESPILPEIVASTCSQPSVSLCWFTLEHCVYLAIYLFYRLEVCRVAWPTYKIKLIESLLFSIADLYVVHACLLCVQQSSLNVQCSSQNLIKLIIRIWSPC